MKSPKVVVDNFIGMPRELLENNQEFIMWMDIMFIKQQELFKKKDKNIRFHGLFPLPNTTKEECYRDFNVLMRHSKKKYFLLNALNVTVSLNQL